jgi:hypothetical protein
LDKQSEIQSEFNTFASQVFSHLEAEEAARVSEQLVLIQAEDMPVFAVPGSKWDLFLTSPQEGELGLHGGSMITAGPPNGMNILMPQTAATAKQLLFAVAQEVGKMSADSKTQMPRNIVVNLRERAEQLTGRRIAI